MAKQIINLVATTELEAVNAMLASIGEAPIDTLDGATQADVQIALNFLRNTTREVQTEGWAFNTEFGYELAPAGVYSRTDSTGIVTELNVFEPPAGLIAFETTQNPDQQGSRYTDASLRVSTEFDTVNKPLLFYDRALNRDGWENRPFLYINPTWLFDFENLPETCRNYIVVQASRRFAAKVAGSAELSGFNDRDELMALRKLKRDQGQDEDYNMLDNADVSSILGGRQTTAGVSDNRNSPGAAGTSQFDPFQFA